MITHAHPTVWMEATSSPGRRAALVGVAAVLAGAVSQVDGPVLCVYRNCTGRACPGCGLSRGVGALLRGDVRASFRFHPLTVFLLIQAAIVTTVWVVGSRRAGRPLNSSAWPSWVVPLVGAIDGVALITVWIIRWRLGLLDDLV